MDRIPKLFQLLGLMAIIALALAFFLVPGCGGLGVQTATDTATVCDQIPEGSHSVICELAAMAGQTPEAVASVLKLANTGALAGDVYTANAAVDFIDEIQEDLAAAAASGDGITYADAIAYVQQKYNVLPKKVAVVFVVLTEFADIDVSGLSNEVLSAYDIGLIQTHLEEQKAIAMMMRAVARLSMMFEMAVS